MEDAFSIKDLSVDNRDGGPGRGEERRGEERRGEERRGEMFSYPKLRIQA